MKKYFFLLLFGIFCCNAWSQYPHAGGAKPSIAHTSYQNWPRAGGTGFSNNGQYIAWKDGINKDKMTLQSIDGKWKRIIQEGDVRFSDDSRWAIVTRNNLVELIRTGNDKNELIDGVQDVKLSQGAQTWIAYRLSTSPGNIQLRNLTTGIKRNVTASGNYLFSSAGETILYATKSNEQNAVFTWHWYDMVGGKDLAFWEGEQAGDFLFDTDGDQLVFVSGKEESDKKHNTIWYYQKGATQASKLVSEETPGIPTGRLIDNGNIRFTSNDSRILFSLQALPVVKQDPAAVSVDVWSYTDIKEQSLQLTESNGYPEFFMSGLPLPQMVINIHDHQKVIQLTTEEEHLIDACGDFALVAHRPASWMEHYWNSLARPVYYLISLQDGSRKMLKDRKETYRMDASLSPSGNYVFFSDDKTLTYFSYETHSGTWHAIKNDPLTFTSDEYGQHLAAKACWIEDQQAVLIESEYDLWKLDLTGNKAPVNVTGGYGKKHQIVFRMERQHQEHSILTPDKAGGYLLNAFDQKNKDLGYFHLPDLSGKEPRLLGMGPYFYSQLSRAKYTPVYTVMRSTTYESPNLFVTKDFKTYTRITDTRPEKDFNWMTSELVHWKAYDGEMCDGILYKPENFDATKKYPLVVHFYNTFTHELNKYLDPEEYGLSHIPVAWLVSNGYLVFMPDIKRKLGTPCESAYNCVVSGAEYLASLPYVDGKHMALQGSSWGGYQTNYLITRTNLFAAVYSGCGLSERISGYGYGSHGYGCNFSSNNGTMENLERGGGLIGAAPWEKPGLYVKEAGLLSADKVQTPFLLMHNKKDGGVIFYQGLQYFRALRRLGKKVWLLQYDQGDHWVEPGKDGIDFHTRIEQFYAHYLKGAPAPRWMLDGIPSRLKGVDTGLELDKAGRKPGPGLLAGE